MSRSSNKSSSTTNNQFNELTATNTDNRVAEANSFIGGNTNISGSGDIGDVIITDGGAVAGALGFAEKVSENNTLLAGLAVEANTELTDSVLANQTLLTSQFLGGLGSQLSGSVERLSSDAINGLGEVRKAITGETADNTIPFILLALVGAGAGYYFLKK